jgi:hypothetical protein
MPRFACQVANGHNSLVDLAGGPTAAAALSANFDALIAGTDAVPLIWEDKNDDPSCDEIGECDWPCGCGSG